MSELFTADDDKPTKATGGDNTFVADDDRQTAASTTQPSAEDFSGPTGDTGILDKITRPMKDLAKIANPRNWDFNHQEGTEKAPIEDAGVGKDLAYAPNLIRTALLQHAKNMAHLVTGRGEGGSMEELKKALKGQATPFSDQLQGIGIPEVPAKVLDFTSGIATDPFLGAFGMNGTATEPLAQIRNGSQIGPGANAVKSPMQKLSDLATENSTGEQTNSANFLSALADKLGLKSYRNALRKIDASAQKVKGATAETETPFSDLAYRKKFLKGSQSPAEMEQATSDYRDNVIGPEYDKLLDSPEANAQRTNISGAVGDAMPGLQEAAKLSLNRPAATKVANQLLKEASLGRKYFPQGRSPRDLLDVAKTYSDVARGSTGLPGDVMNKLGNASVFKQLLMDVAQSMRNKVQDMAETAIPGSADKIKELNRQYSVLKNASKPLVNQGMVEARKYPITQVDAGLAGAALNHPSAIPIELFKQGGRYLNSPRGGVAIGNILRDYGKSPIWDMALRKAAIESKPLTGDENELR